MGQVGRPGHLAGVDSPRREVSVAAPNQALHLTRPADGVCSAHRASSRAAGVAAGQVSWVVGRLTMESERPHVAVTPHDLEAEAQDLTRLLGGKIVRSVWRHRPREFGIEFTDGTRIFIDAQTDGLETSLG